MKRILIFLLMAASAIGSACLWDRDTLGMEAKRFPGLAQVITGRFERNPPLYYQMRLDRVEQEIKEHPEKLELYDDAGVACDRLGKGEEAIAWMAKKKAVLDRSPHKDHLYRYHANLGTFLAHEWFRGKQRAEQKLLKQGRDHIAKAIEINPDAHFGREKVQLGVMEWALKILAPKPTSPDDESPQVLREFLVADGHADEAEAKDLAKGLAGLVVLGNAWESVDVFATLSEVLVWRDASMASLAAMRADELLKQGRKSLDPMFKLEQHQIGDRLLDEGAEVRKHFTLLRKEADDWAKKREAYMIERLKQGRHPDTDADFWKGWKGAGPPEIPVPLINWRGLPWPTILLVGGVGLLLSVGVITTLRAAKKMARRLNRKA